jgi:hypothetical protein
MGYPCAFMEGSKYANLTTIRVSDDRFQERDYRDFFYTSRFAKSLGIWPWVDVFKSHETDNLLLSTLSAGPVGTGDALGKEDKDNLLRAMRADGVIIKPDVPITPVDASYIAEGQKLESPLIAATYTDHDGLRTVYLTAFQHSKTKVDAISVPAADVGISKPVFLYDYFAGTGTRLNAGDPLPVQFHGKNLAYFVAAPITTNGIALLGDQGKFVGTGKKRMTSLKDDGSKLRAELLLAAPETGLTLHGYAAKSPGVSVQGGTAGAVHFNAATGYFSVDVKADATVPPVSIDGDPARKITVILASS